MPGTAFDNSEKSAGSLLRKNASFLFPFFFLGSVACGSFLPQAIDLKTGQARACNHQGWGGGAVVKLREKCYNLKKRKGKYYPELFTDIR